MVKVQANELRIGNIVNRVYAPERYGDLQEVIKVDAVIIFDIVNKHMSAFTYTPIPLTPEILEACGFEIYICSVTKDDIILTSLAGGEYEFHDYRRCKIKYLHQLQNLYFALSGQELAGSIPIPNYPAGTNGSPTGPEYLPA